MHEDISLQLQKGGRQDNDSLYYVAEHTTAGNSRTAGDTKHHEMGRLLEFLQEGGAGYLPRKKREGWVRIMFENWNILGFFMHSWKLDRLNYLIRHLHLDMMMGCQSQCDWSFLSPGQQLLDRLCPELAKIGIALHNTNERISWEQMGGTAITGLG
jgi:hypothetical protein